MDRRRALPTGPGQPAPWAWSWLGGRPPTTVAGAETAVILLLIGTRLGMLVQGLPSLVGGVSSSPAPFVYVVCWGAAATAATAVSVASFLRGRALPDRVQVADIALAATLLLLGPWTVTEEHRIGTWEGFQPGYALSVVMSIAVMRRSGLWWAGLTAIVLSQICYVASAFDTVSFSTTLGNLFTVVILGAVGRVSVQYLRRVAEDADDARARASELARLQEEQRAQVAIHNGAAVMHLLGEPDLDDVTRDRLLEQAQYEATRMRAYLRGGPRTDLGGTGDDSAPQALADAVSRTCRTFDDLVIEVALDLGQGVLVDPAVAAAVQNALTSLLLNVRVHAGARLVVVHLDAGDAFPPTGWVLSVHDDGCGFDLDDVALGVGLREVVHGELGRHGVEVRLESARGAGTTVTLSGGVVSLPHPPAPLATTLGAQR
ncbi:sensor histidine kinase [Nocardioides dongxiaopingii]|uniref:sensor histidine kinase n=1 Tax=Nocardioides dongxiaopingii TaxID=2576036 RepID=UPI0010C76FED|nr:ATP-binding protein [Nocardioides dongxiaopingii]